MKAHQVARVNMTDEGPQKLGFAWQFDKKISVGARFVSMRFGKSLMMHHVGPHMDCGIAQDNVAKRSKQRSI